MASGFPVNVNGNLILSSEALYQACRYPFNPEVQQKILLQKSPMTAKMVGKPYVGQTRPDWDKVRIQVMRWCLRVKLAQNFISFGAALDETGSLPIVEDSSKDDFWGAIRTKETPDMLRGVNALGRLLMELRQFCREKRLSSDVFVVEPLCISDFFLLGEPITVIDWRKAFVDEVTRALRLERSDLQSRVARVASQSSSRNYSFAGKALLFDRLVSASPLRVITREDVAEEPKKKIAQDKSGVKKARKVVNQWQHKLPF